MTTLPLRADHVGSLLRPAELLTAHEANMRGELDATALRQMEDREIAAAVAMQESLGLHVATDGEFRRTSFHFDFLGQLDGVDAKLTRDATAGAPPPGQPFTPPTLKVTGKVRHSRNIEVDNFKFVKSHAKTSVAKQAIPSPTMLLRSGRGGVSTEAYPDMEAYYEDAAAAYRAEIKALADAGCTYLQLDDTNFAYLCDTTMRENIRRRGDDPDQVLHDYAMIINKALEDRPAGMTVCMHVCRGNAGSQWAASGGYEPVADVMFNEVGIDGYFLEFDSERAGSFDPLRFLPKTGKRVVLGLVSSKLARMEPKDELRRRIDEASQFAPLEAMCLSPQCGFASGFRGNDVPEDIEKRKLALVVEMAEEVWGTAQ